MLLRMLCHQHRAGLMMMISPGGREQQRHGDRGLGGRRPCVALRQDRGRLVRGHGSRKQTRGAWQRNEQADPRDRECRGTGQAYLDRDNAPQSLFWGGSGGTGEAGLGRAWRERKAFGGIRGGFRDRQEGKREDGAVAKTDLLGDWMVSGSPGLAQREDQETQQVRGSCCRLRSTSDSREQRSTTLPGGRVAPWLAPSPHSVMARRFAPAPAAPALGLALLSPPSPPLSAASQSVSGV